MPHPAETRDASAVFDRWIQWQRIFEDCPLSGLGYALDEAFLARFSVNRLAPHHPVGSPALLFFEEPFLTNPVAALLEWHALFDHDLSGLCARLQAHGLLSPAIDRLEAEWPVNRVIDKYRHFVAALFGVADPALHAAALFAVGNRVFDHCFRDATHEDYRALLARPGDRSFVRLLHSLMWHHLSAEGWRDWHRSTLERLKAEVGKTVVYIAGGCDFYQLLLHGIHDIEVIDPFLPSQSSYYSEGWSWLIAEQALGDCITMDCGGYSLVLRRESHQNLDTFEAVLSTGETAVLTRCKVGWGVFSDFNERRLGTVTLHRRFAETADFAANDRRSMLLSFNELHLFATSRDFGGWGLDLNALDPARVIHIKQLRAPITVDTLRKMRATEALPFRFINLGSCAT
jgi:hypothetical protein